MTSFLQLEDYLLPAPLTALMAVLMCLGLKYSANRLSLILRNSSPDIVKSAAGFILVTGLVAFLSNLLAFWGLAYLWPLRIMAWLLASLGIIELLQLRRNHLTSFVQRFQYLYNEQTIWGQVGILLICIIVAALCLATLGPPTDADSLDYHLGVPLDILRHNQAYPRPDWLCARLTGLGESLNMLGLAGGTDIFGACLQFSGLIAVLIAMTSLSETDFDRIMMAMIVVGCPVILELIPVQKPQMLPAAATTISLILIIRRFRLIDTVTMILAFGGVCFAMSCKYSFVLSGSIVIGVGMIAAYQNGRFWTATSIALAGFVIFLFPVYLQKFLFYGDPVTPLLEKFFPHGDEVVINFASILQTHSESSFAFPLSLMLPDSLGTVTRTLGLGTLLIIAAPSVRGDSRIFIVCALLSVILTLLLGQVTARFYLEPYLWIAAAVGTVTSGKFKPIFFKLMLIQMAGVTIVAIFSAVTLFPGALSATLRHQVMSKYAYQYADMEWLDTVLPKNAVVLTDLRSKALMPRPFISNERVNYLGGNTDGNELGKSSSYLKPNSADTWVTYAGVPAPYFASLFPIPVSEPKTFKSAVKNPWYASTYSIMIYRSRVD
ncbi:MAG: DUF1420 family protein [Desulfobacterales bacterium]|nr:DUF1420 family protein [Deltaproteobacteria bacterium]MBL6970658.1 DUF1420 family protein [Desulfobacterales bacterium]